MIKNNFVNFKKVAIIILNYNSGQDTVECLESLQKIDYPDYLIIVIDNASFDGSVEKIKSWAEGKVKVIEYEKEIAEQGGIEDLEEELRRYSNDKKVVLIKNNANLGYSAGNNVGIRYSIKKNVDAVLIVNPDVRIEDPSTLRKMVDVMFSNDSVYIVGPNIIDAEGNRQNPLREPTFIEECVNPFISAIKKRAGNQPINYLIPIKTDKPFEVEKVAGSCLLIRTSFLKRIGLFDENVFLYCEEPILAVQVKKDGGQIFFVSSVIVKHLHRKPSGVYLHEFFKNRLYFLKHYKGYTSLQLWIIAFVQKAIKNLLRRKAVL